MAAKLKDQDVHLIFRGYYAYSTKSLALEDRSTCSRVHQLNRDFQLPPRDIVLPLTKIKMQLNKLNFLGHLGGSIILSPCHTTSSIDTDWTRPHSTTISEGQLYPKLDLASCHEEADIVITQEAVMATCHNAIWWCGCLFPPELASPMYMVSPDWQQTSTDISETTARIEDIARDLPAIHALSGCDTVAATYSTGELTEIKAVHRGKSLSLMGNVTAHLCPPTLHRKQQNSSQHIMVNMLRGALHLQDEGRKCRPTKLVEEKLQPINFVHPHQHQLRFLKMLTLSGVQLKIGIAPRPSISESSWTGLESRHREQIFVGPKPSRCNCIGTRLHP